MRYVIVAAVAVVLCLMFGLSKAKQDQIKLVNNFYTDILIAIKPEVPEDPKLIQRLQTLFTIASEVLYTATKRRAKFGNINILVPANWTFGNNLPASTLNYEESDIRVAPSGAGYLEEPHTVQPGDCGEYGEYTHISPAFITNDQLLNNFGPKEKVIVREWAHLRWGVFDEHATDGYQSFYIDDDTGVAEATRCTKGLSGDTYEIDYDTSRTKSCALNPVTSLPINENCTFLPNLNSGAVTASFLSHSYIPNVLHFCHSDESDANNLHNEFAPNQHNRLCNFASTWDVISTSSDFKNDANPPNATIQSLPPVFKIFRTPSYRKFSLVLDTSRSMSGSHLTEMRQALTIFLEKVLPLNDHVALTTFSTFAFPLVPLTELRSEEDRQSIINRIPNVARGSSCVGCGLREGIEALTGRDGSRSCGDVVVITDGAETVRPFVREVKQLATNRNCKVHAIFLKTSKTESLKQLTEATGGKWFHAQDNDLSTLIGAFTKLAERNDGSARRKSEQISMLELEQLDLQANVPNTGLVYIDNLVGRETTFYFFWQTYEVPEVRLTSPNGCTYSTRRGVTQSCGDRPISDTSSKVIRFKISGTAKSGIWVYRVISASDHTVTVFAASKRRIARILPIQVRTWFTQFKKGDPILLRVLVTMDGVGISNLRVQTTIKTPNGSEYTVLLQDDGIGADRDSNDGVYSKYFVKEKTPGRYNMMAKVQYQGVGNFSPTRIISSRTPLKLGHIRPNGLLSMTSPIQRYKPRTDPPLSATEVGRFTRIDTAEGLELGTPDDISDLTRDTFAPNRVTDLKVRRSSPTDIHQGIVLEFTAPGGDADEGTATRYEICYTFGSGRNLVRNFLNNICPQSFLTGDLSGPGASGSKEVFILTTPARQGKRRIRFAIRTWDNAGNVAKSSNVANLSFFTSRNQQVTPTTKPIDGCSIGLLPPLLRATREKRAFAAGDYVFYTCTGKGVNLIGDYWSLCQASGQWSTPTPFCEDIDECTENTDDCHRSKGTCINSFGSFTCVCQKGFRGDGRACSDIDECKENTNNCHPQRGICTNTLGSFTCNCQTGFDGDGRNCNEIGQCGQAGNIRNMRSFLGRVIGGTDANEGAWPWHAAITKVFSQPEELYKAFQAGGSLINHKWILTASHVFGNDQRVGNWYSNYLLVLGLNRLQSNSVSGDHIRNVKIFRSEQIYLHENFNFFPSNRTDFNYDYDVALVKIGREYEFHRQRLEATGNTDGVRFTPSIKPVCLPCVENSCLDDWLKTKGFSGTEPPEMKCKFHELDVIYQGSKFMTVVTGFGITQPETFSPSSVLRQGHIKIKRKVECSAAINHMKGGTYYFTDRMICAIGELNNRVIDACQGDSGGPLVIEIYNTISNRSCWVQVGIVSWGYSCGKKYTENGKTRYFPGYYTNVFSVLPWIRARINGETGLG